MNVYAESSAILAWLLDEPNAPQVRQILAAAEFVVTSELTLAECDRALIRLFALGEQTREDHEEAQERLRQVAAYWELLRLDVHIVERVRYRFPAEPLRTLDALHMASALVAREALVQLTVLSFDRRLRACARQMDFEVVPDESGESR